MIAAVVLLAATSIALLDANQTAYAAGSEELIEEGRRLFLEETFDGNGRTCGTCHPPSNNFTLDRDFISKLPGNDPLFIAAPRLRGQLRDLEVMRMIKRHGLFVENVDGLDQPGVLRSVPYTLALRTTTRRSGLGWSGDGSPSPGTLHSFATGAVIQHFTKDMRRRPGIDFRLPTPEELDAMEAFQLSLGRQEDIDLAALNFTDDTAQLGKERFLVSPIRNGGTRSCNGCHVNAGSSDGQNATGAARLPTAPACIPSSTAPGDGGRGSGPEVTVARAELCGRGPRGGPNATVTYRGDESFNPPPLIEAADTPPFFHNNAVETLEEAVTFYTTDTFNDSPSGEGDRAFDLNQDEVNAIAAMLRALNVLENIRSANAYAAQALEQDGERAAESLRLSIAETTDAIDVLVGGTVPIYGGTDLLSLLQGARQLEQDALDAGLPDVLLGQAIALREEARDLMLQ